MSTTVPTRRRTTTPRRSAATRTEEVRLTAEGRALLAERARTVREVLLPALRPHLVDRERDERDVAEFERLSAELERLEHLVDTAELLPESTDGTVQPGSRVLIEMHDGERAWVRPVHAVEAFLDDERISYTSPVSQALMGAVAGDVVPVHGPAGVWSCSVVEVEQPKRRRAARKRAAR